jgi:hypothetical protein
MKPQNITLKPLWDANEGIENVARFFFSNIEMMIRKPIVKDLKDGKMPKTIKIS